MVKSKEFYWRVFLVRGNLFYHLSIKSKNLSLGITPNEQNLSISLFKVSSQIWKLDTDLLIFFLNENKTSLMLDGFEDVLDIKSVTHELKSCYGGQPQSLGLINIKQLCNQTLPLNLLRVGAIIWIALITCASNTIIPNILMTSSCEHQTICMKYI